jgi:hypothetical protein
VHVEDAVRPRDDLDDADDVLPLLEDARRQTGSVGPRPSGDAVLDPDVMALDHRFRFNHAASALRRRTSERRTLRTLLPHQSHERAGRPTPPAAPAGE